MACNSPFDVHIGMAKLSRVYASVCLGISSKLERM